MPFKFHASRRHHIPRAKYRVMNWPDYDRGLVRRGDIRFWIDESALEQWDAAKRRTTGGQRRFSELAISTTLMLGMVFRLPLRQTEGFVRSLVDLMGCDLPVPDHTTLSRRRRTVDVVVETSTNKWPTDIVLDSTGLKFFGAGEWARAKHGETRRSWRKLHISVDPASSEIRTHELTGDDTADATMAGPLVAGSGGMIRRVFADGAYDGEPVTKAIRDARPPNSPPEIIIPPRATSIPPPDTPHGDVVTLTAIWPACGRRRRRLCNGRHLPPLSHRVAAELAECSAGDQMALDVEEVVDGRMDGEEPLRGRGRFEPLHLSLSSSHRLM